ncbi:MAG: TonB-dependent receptor [Alphaproteobacteria bacterium]|uniref:TonB-dependent receptor n=1 Tax=Candidatus Nitrobium versatile TaxID=2884831 RepID=A0A953J327_9BACT|nr:TonB-dependent receptor [Candidatus Nitrobium versatile]
MKRFCFICLLLLAGTKLVFGQGAMPGEAGDKAGKETVVESLEEVVVTGSREAEPLKETPQAVGVIKEKEIEETRPAHPSEIMRTVPGVWVDVTAGEGHKTAIRQPLTTNPVYLYLEDGIPIRSTGFFNHNALYEVNVPGAERIEVIKGPATALYGSDAIGGTINVITRPSPAKPEVEINPEVGEFGWYRFLATGGTTWGNNGFRIDLNTTHSDGWRDRSGYDRQSVTLRWDRVMGDDASLKTIIGFSNIDQDTGGASGLTKADFETRPSFNYYTFDFRKVRAFRASTEYERGIGEKGSLSLIPYFRHNEMDLLPGWGIFQSGSNFFGYDSTTKFYSLGLLAKYRQDFDFWKSRLIGGIDIDYSPGDYFERRIQVTKSGDRYVSYTYVASTDNNFDYAAIFTGISPYLQFETSPFRRLRITAGARYDTLSHDYTTHLEPNANRPPDTTRTFSHLSPKIGFTYDFTESLSGFASYSNAFRAPSSGDLFRGSQGTASTSVNLRSIKADSYEIGVRGGIGQIAAFSASLYYMTKKDDIVSFSPTPGVTERLNAGETEHKGIEIGIGVKPVKDVEVSSSFSYAVHRYKEYVVSSTIDYSGNEIAVAPRVIMDTRVDYRPPFLKGGLAELEWVKLGRYWMDDANTEQYGGHDLFNIRASYYIAKQWEIYARVINVTDEPYAEEATKSASGAARFSPGQPRTFFGGLVYKWGGRQ